MTMSNEGLSEERLRGIRIGDYSAYDYWIAPSDGPLAAEWNDKPHRLIYDLLRHVEGLAGWKESAIKLLPLQEWGEALNLRFGEDIHSKILPALNRLLSAEAEVRRLKEDLNAAADQHVKLITEVGRLTNALGSIKKELQDYNYMGALIAAEDALAPPTPEDSQP